MKQYFVTGTDTGVGKTFIACALARRARERNATTRVFAFKPVETGCAESTAHGDPRGEDQRAIVAAAGGWQTGDLAGLYTLRLPAAPSVAARAEGLTIDGERILETYRLGSQGTTLAVVEGAGGWRVPITDDLDMAGLAQRLAIPVIVVARGTLGTINHSLLTVEAVELDGCPVAALVLSQRPDDDPAFAESNAREIARRWDGRVLVLGNDPTVLDPLL